MGLYNLVRVEITTTGTGNTLALGSTADPGYQTPAAAGVANSEVVPYSIEDGLAREYGTAVFNSSLNQMTRTRQWSSTGSNLNLSGSARFMITARAEDLKFSAAAALAAYDAV